MLQDTPPLETAEEKAQRIWRNSTIIKATKSQQPLGAEFEKVLHDNIWNIYSTNPNPLIKFRRDIRSIILHNPSRKLYHYLASIQSQKHKLLTEKLKRMERG